MTHHHCDIPEHRCPEPECDWDDRNAPAPENVEPVGCVWCKGRTLMAHDCRNFAHLKGDST